ncbi:MAG: hypothetical protein R2731_14590 [Nocardioides sp.]
MARTVVATANVLGSLARADARLAVAAVLARDPDLVGLQEWSPRRVGLLGEWASYRWLSAPLGGCAVGVRADRYAVRRRRLVPLGPPQRADNPDRWWGLEPPRLALAVSLVERATALRVGMVSFHLTPGVQRRGRYRDDRPALVDRHRREVTRLSSLVARLIAHHDRVYAVGDSNFDGLALPGLVSCWVGRESHPGTLGPRRHVDDVLGLGPADSVELVETPSDHRAVVVWVEGGGAEAG